jgi:predicted acyltransferase
MSPIGARRIALGMVAFGIVLLAIGLVWVIVSPLPADAQANAPAWSPCCSASWFSGALGP